ncbi:hypothetical protein C265_18579 [Cupriavidus sp. GA3-3]|nr:amino acid permease C-terminal domain-containing protein [Cupriavidus sp. GA3-3]EON18165.1 hypothetical protein C265_18579 [Cupriavidus sp. GA3-3]
MKQKCVAIAAALALLAPALASAEVKVGILATLSGPSADVGRDQYDGFLLAVEQGGGKLGGQPVRLIKEDDQARPDAGLAGVRRLLELERVATPYFATWTVGIVFAMIAAFMPLNVLAELINIGTLSAFTLISIAVLVLRRTRPELPRAFRCPGVPVVPLLSVGFCLFLMAHLQALTWIAFLIWLGIGLSIYFLYARRNAVLHGGQVARGASRKSPETR